MLVNAAGPASVGGIELSGRVVRRFLLAQAVAGNEWFEAQSEMGTKRLKAVVVERPVTVEITVSEGSTSFTVAESEGECLPLYFRRASYLLPAFVVTTPMPTLTCRHLERATLHLMQGQTSQTLLAFKRAVASAIDPASLIKVALACHTEGYAEEAEAALLRGLRYANRDARCAALIRTIAQHLNYPLAH